MKAIHFQLKLGKSQWCLAIKAAGRKYRLLVDFLNVASYIEEDKVLVHWLEVDASYMIDKIFGLVIACLSFREIIESIAVTQ